MDIEEAILSRRSVRAFRDDPVPRESVEAILALAARAPSGTNMQPWRVYAVAGAAKIRLSQAILRARESEPENHVQEYRYYPEWREPYLGRRRKLGWDLYDLLGIERGDKAAMHRQHGRNFEIFGAPVGLIFALDRDLKVGSWLDLGMFLQNVMLASRGQGLATCPQAAFAPYHQVIRGELGIPDDQVIVCGMALGHEDETAPEAKLRTERAEPRDFARFIGFDETA